MGLWEFVDSFALSGKFLLVMHVFASLCSQTTFSHLPIWSLPTLSHDPFVILITYRTIRHQQVHSLASSFMVYTPLLNGSLPMIADVMAGHWSYTVIISAYPGLGL